MSLVEKILANDKIIKFGNINKQIISEIWEFSDKLQNLDQYNLFYIGNHMKTKYNGQCSREHSWLTKEIHVVEFFITIGEKKIMFYLGLDNYGNGYIEECDCEAKTCELILYYEVSNETTLNVCEYLYKHYFESEEK